MVYLFELNHPKHYYQFKYVMQMLRRDGHKIQVIARDKDVLLDVLRQEGVYFEVFGKHYKGLFNKVIGTLPILHHYAKLVRRVNPDVIVSKASFYGCLMAKLYGKKSFIFPDSEVVKVTNRYVVPLASWVITPQTFGLDYGKKHLRVKGFFENCYLAPSVFTPDEKVVADSDLQQPYAIFRFVGWFANHDVGNNGFILEQKLKMIRLVERRMKVYISSEKKLPEQLKQYKLPVKASDIHHALAFAALYVGDSQTMATEAALLGTPALRSNSFVGPNDMTNFKILEHKYHLLRNVADFDNVMTVLDELSKAGMKQHWQQLQQKYFSEVGDTNSAIVEMLEK